jgi:hypothetical protein
MISMNLPLLRLDLGPATHSPSHLPANTGRVGERHDLSGPPALIWAIAAGTCRPRASSPSTRPRRTRAQRRAPAGGGHSSAGVVFIREEWCSFELHTVVADTGESLWKAEGRLVACPPVCAFTPRTEQNRTRCSSNCWLNLRPGHRLHRSCKPDCSRTS